jgi:hypothetical protein
VSNLGGSSVVTDKQGDSWNGNFAPNAPIIATGQLVPVGSISIAFATQVSAVGAQMGYSNEAGSPPFSFTEVITAYDFDGNLLGTFTVNGRENTDGNQLRGLHWDQGLHSGDQHRGVLYDNLHRFRSRRDRHCCVAGHSTAQVAIVGATSTGIARGAGAWLDDPRPDAGGPFRESGLLVAATAGARMACAPRGGARLYQPSFFPTRGATAGRVQFFFLEFRSRDNISLNVNLSAPPVTPIPTPVSIFTTSLL